MKKPAYLLVLIILFSLIASAHAQVLVQWLPLTEFATSDGTPVKPKGPYVICGPIAFPGHAGLAKLTLYNGSVDHSDKSERVLYAKVFINGNMVVSPHNWSPAKAGFETEIALNKGRNTIMVELRKKPSGKIIVGITQHCISAPQNVSAEYQPAFFMNFIYWNPVPGAASYKLYWGTEPDVTVESEYGGETLVPEFSHASLVAGQAYYYRVLAVDARGNESELSEQAHVYLSSGLIPDTGQILCYDNDGNVIECPQPGEAFYGQDGNYAINPPSYSKLDADGNDLPETATEWAMVRDNVTALIWEAKTDKDGVQDYDNIFTWYDSDPATNGGDAGTPGDGTDTENFINALNGANFGGYSDWRLPTVKELSWLVRADKSFHDKPTIDTTYFQNTGNENYWSSTANAHNMGWAWTVCFNNAFVGESNNKSNSNYARAVRGGQ